MQLELFINFDGCCREAVEFYAKVFRSQVHNFMTYGEVPSGEDYPVQETDKDRIMYAGMTIGGMTVMFMDMQFGMPVAAGNQINPTISIDDKEEVTRIFHELKEGGEVYAELSKTFFSEWYGMVRDKYGLTWQILMYSPE